MRRIIPGLIGLVLLLASRSHADPQNPNTDWFKEARYGIFMHFLPADADGLALVERFDVAALANQLERAGAGYFVITLGQNTGYFISPNASYDAITGYEPAERCAQRDLPLDLARALAPKGIRLMLYLPCQAPNEDARAQQAFGLAVGKRDQPLDLDFARKWARVIQEWSERYGDKLAGWWFDGGYEHIRFNEAIAAVYARAAKSGNPKAIVTFNPGVRVIRYTKAEDYTAGELNEPFSTFPAGRWLEGSQWHALTYLGANWAQRNTRFRADQWVEWIRTVVAKEGVVTLDLGPNYDPKAGPVGALAPDQLQQVEAVRAAVRGSTKPAALRQGRSETNLVEAEARPWFPFRPARDDFEPTILDCSRWVEAPTGRHGFVKVDGERFVFNDGTPVRFWGAQMNLWGKEQTDYAVRRMRRQGINITRLHGLNNLGSDERSFERLDYLIAKLGENGIYIILDLHYPLTHRFKASDNIPGLPQGGTAPYTQFFHARVAELMHQRMSNVFTHLNLYTNKRYCDDPTLAMVEILNEDSLFWGTVEAPFRAELEARFAEWLRHKYGDDAGLRKAWTAGGAGALGEGEGLESGQHLTFLRNWELNEKYLGDHPERAVRAQDQMRFCYELEVQYWEGCRSVLRQAGVKVPIDATNWQGHGLATRVHMLGQSRLDYIDRHGYWDHPEGEGNSKWRIVTARFHDLPMIKAVQPDQDKLTYLGVGNLVTEKAWEQVLGMPMTISEWNTCLPNEYSLEGTGLMAAYGLLQGWDASLQFGYFSPDWPKALSGGSFDLLGNPPQILQFPAASMMWLRQDVKEADVIAESMYDRESVFRLTDDRKPVPVGAALVGKVGYRFVDQARAPLAKNLQGYWDPKARVARSVTGELTWDAGQGFVRIDTPRTQAVLGFVSTEPHPLRTVTIQSPTRFAAIYVTAMDELAPIQQAHRLLVTAVGPARNTGMEYDRTDQRSRLGGPLWHLKAEGGSPALLEAVTGEIQVRSDHASELKAWALDCVGRRSREVPLRKDGGVAHLELRAEYATVYYELGL